MDIPIHCEDCIAYLVCRESIDEEAIKQLEDINAVTEKTYIEVIVTNIEWCQEFYRKLNALLDKNAKECLARVSTD